MSNSKLTGVTQVLGNLKRLESDVKKNITRYGIRKGADFLVEKLQAAAPRDSGILAASIKRERRKKNESDKYTQIVHTGDAFWAAFIEFGTGVRRPKHSNILMSSSGQKFGKEAKGVKPNPFFTRTWESNKDEVLDVVTEAYRKRIAKHHKKVSK